MNPLDPLAALAADEDLVNKYRGWVAAIDKDGVNLTRWEIQHVARVARKLQTGQQLTENEAYKLEQIYAERTP